MIFSQNCKFAYVFYPVSKTDGGTASGQVDTIGYDQCQLVFIIATGSSTGDAPEVCKVSEGDTSTAWTAIPAFTGGTATSTSVGFVIPNSHATVEQLYAMNIDLKGRKRWIKVELTPETTQINGCIAILSRPDIMPDSTTEAGVALLVNG
jgi:hypothetical protein